MESLRDFTCFIPAGHVNGGEHAGVNGMVLGGDFVVVVVRGVFRGKEVKSFLY